MQKEIEKSYDEEDLGPSFVFNSMYDKYQQYLKKKNEDKDNKN